MIGSRHAPVPATTGGLYQLIGSPPDGSDEEFRRRLESVLATLDGATVAMSADAPGDVADRLQEGKPDHMWLALAVVVGELPDQATVQRALRRADVDGALIALTAAVTDHRHATPSGEARRHRRVEVVTNQVVIDFHHTSGTAFATGIQRVAREVVWRWERAHEVVLVGWTSDYTALRRLPRSAIEGISGEAGPENGSLPAQGPIVVPWKCTYLLPELLGEVGRVDRFHALARYSGNKSGAIGFDCVPLTTGETAVVGMSADFAHYLAAIGQTDRVATISEAAAVEFRGWRGMLKGAGLSGPEITPIPLPFNRPSIEAHSIATARQELAIVGLPMVLVVGSHEPRKNHRAILHAAELLWRRGLKFSLLFVGGNSWNSEGFTAALHDLQDSGRPVHAVRALRDDLLWAAYRIARCTLFPSLNEGFGLPVAESIASGTPVITSNFGSMREIAKPGGALLVDPRDDHDIAQALQRLLTDDRLHATLVKQANDRPQRSWEHYAQETWEYLVQGKQPGH